MKPAALIVDDSLTVRMDLADALRAAGFRCTVCDTLAKARAELGRATPDVVILDVVLPDGDGVDLLHEIRAQHGATLPVLMLSSEAEVRDRVRGLTMGASKYVGKPYDTAFVVALAGELTRAKRDTHARSRPVLVIDDSLTFRRTLADLLATEGHDVVTAENGEEGLRLASRHRPAAILVDGVLPGIDGPTVIRRIRLDSALRGIPCILLTAAEAAEVELHALDSGADAFVRKDQDLSVILAKVRAAIRNAAVVADDATAPLSISKRILAVDDSPTFRAHIATALQADDYDVIVAESAEQALELLAVQPVDCILLDVVMPGMDGKEACARIKALPALRDVPVIVLSALDDRASMIDMLAVGADDYIEKSAELPVLKARVRAQLRRRQFEEETRRVRERLLRSQLEAAQAHAARELAETRAALAGELERKNHDLVEAMRELRDTQGQLVQSAKMASLGSLVAGVAHEINNPLSFVISHVETARRNLAWIADDAESQLSAPAAERSQRAQDRLREISLGLDRMRDLVVKLRTFSRLDEGERKRVSVRECVVSLLTILQHRCRGRIAVNTAFGEPDQLTCYPSLLTQAIMNVVANAIDAIEGEGTIDITTGAEGNDYVITVRDTGPGIPLELRDRIFDPFFTTKGVGEGTGLGLSITDSIVRKHEGTLTVSDVVPHGAQVTIRLPMTAL